jgi:hypothetical protein
MFKQHKIILILILFPVITGCASKKITYTAAGTLIGAGGGYALDHDGKDAAIGGLAGGITGAVVANVHEKRENKKYKEGYDQGYTQAQLEIAVEDWDTNTGKKEDEAYSKSYQRIKVPKKEMNDVIYESHYETLEVYQ